MPATNRLHYSGSYQRQARAVRLNAERNPDTRCWRTGLTLAEGRAKWGDKVRWQAGHVIDGMVNGPLAAELSHPNQSEGARRGNAQRTEPHSERW